MRRNGLDAVVTAEDLAAVQTAVAAIRARLPFLVGLTKEERAKLPRVPQDAAGFLEETLRAAKQYSELLPRALDVAAMERDLALVAALELVALDVGRLNALVQSTLAQARAESYTASLAVYRNIKSAPPGSFSDTVKQRLGRFFEANGQRLARADEAAAPGDDGE